MRLHPFYAIPLLPLTLWYNLGKPAHIVCRPFRVNFMGIRFSRPVPPGTILDGNARLSLFPLIYFTSYYLRNLQHLISQCFGLGGIDR